ncbi:hypothetical protein Z043_112897 [Scleropages formosus]|uniref:GDNF/GAS1 domain-containing protein n=1 Tax=Scleropages formosus TaxID=113540 RepID=A0A0P7YL73_SCLFO|nr:hypothetical protein Z043_112897 [Scleropages formosus]
MRMLQVALSAGLDCLQAGDSCSSDDSCSPRLRTLRQCVAGDGSMKLGPGARNQCTNAVNALLSSPLHGCQCKRGMKREKNCLSIYWSLHQSVLHGLNLVENFPYEAVEKDYDYVRLASIAAVILVPSVPAKVVLSWMTLSQRAVIGSCGTDQNQPRTAGAGAWPMGLAPVQIAGGSRSAAKARSEVGVSTVNRCLDAAKACNVDETCQKLRTEYVSACIKPSARAGTCNRPKCHKALRKFFDRVPPEYTHELLFCPCTDTACAERRRQTVVPACSYEDKEKPNCLAQLRTCKADYVCSRDCRVSETPRTSVDLETKKTA